MAFAGSKEAKIGQSSSTSDPDLSIHSDNISLHPGGFIQPPDGEEKLLGNSPSRFRAAPFDFLREIQLHVSGVSWRAYDKPIGQEIYYSGFTDHIKSSVLQNENLKAKVRSLADARVQEEQKRGLAMLPARRLEIERQLTDVAEKMTDNMICKFENKTFIRGAAYLCTQLVTRAYHQGIHVSSSEVLRIKAIASEAKLKKQSMIFLPCHRSHVDYVSLQLICFRLGIALPTVVAGDNLNFPLVGKFLQNAGAMWIRRSFGNDALYTSVVQAYIDTLLKGGYNLECFIEGGRSRVGKLLPPKFGILSFILDSLLSGRVQDAIICPVSTQYDKVIETEGYVSELLGTPKKKENLMDFLSASSVLSLKLGRVDVRFHEPWSLRSFIDEQLASAKRSRILRTLGYRVLADINAVSVVMPTALVGTVLLTLRGRGVGVSELTRRVDWLSERVVAKGGRVAHFGKAPTATVVDRALEVLGPQLVGVIDDLPEKTFFAVDRFQLSFYRNMTIHLFVSEALVCVGMYTRIKQGGGPANQQIPRYDLQSQVGFLSRLFRGEFIFPSAGLIANLDKTLRGLASDNVIRLTESNSVELSAAERACGRENYDFYCFLIWPFIEASWLGAVALMGLTPFSDATRDAWLDTKAVQTNAQLLGKTLYHQGDLSYFEAVNREVLGNAINRLISEGILQVETKTGSGTRIRIAPEWRPSRDPQTNTIRNEGRLWDWCEKIAVCRREGKNRRDGATVARRVLSLADSIGRQLFETTVEPPPTSVSTSPAVDNSVSKL